MKRIIIITILTLAMCLTACDGGSGGDEPAPPPDITDAEPVSSQTSEDIYELVIEEFYDLEYPDSAYAIFDIDWSGTDELLVRYSDGTDVFTRLYTHTDGAVNELAEFWSRNSLLLDDYGNIYTIGSNGADNTVLEIKVISSDGTELEVLEYWERYGNVYSHISGDETEEITEEEFGEAFDMFDSVTTEIIDSLDWQVMTGDGAFGSGGASGGIRTDEFAREVYSAFMDNAIDQYEDIVTEEWLEFSAEEKERVYDSISAMLIQLGFHPVPLNGWIAEMDSDADFYSDYYIRSFAIENMGYDDADGLWALFRYAEGMEEGAHGPLHPEILAAADVITIEYYLDSYLLCIGGTHCVTQMTREWMAQEPSFMQGGSVTPIDTGDIFENVSIDYIIYGENESFQRADFGDTDLLPVMRGIGAIADDGAMLGQQLQISARSTFNAPKLFVMTEAEDGLITFAVAVFDEASGIYNWDGEVIRTYERCCFDADGNFLYIDENGSLQTISE